MIKKLGSLFDGSGGFPLAGALCDIEPVWASEIEPYPIAVTKSRFPKMKHLGDISKINGAEIEPVDIITFGSPCQDLSVAGKRAGLKHQNHGDGETTRSGLFMEAVRIIKEMREKTNGKYPRFAMWENVPGAFSSNKGEDFRIVLEELIKIAEPNAVMPEVPKKGWAYADSYIGDGWSLAYRVLDAQYWGVPQRRRRIYLVADFGGQCAREILFEREGLRGYFTQGRTPWKATSADAERGIRTDDRARSYGVVTKGNGDAFVSLERHTALSTGGGQAGQGFPCVAYGISAYESNSMKSSNPHSGVYKADTSRTIDLNGGHPACNQGGIAIVEPFAVATQQGGAEVFDNGICPTITAAAGMSGNNQPWICQGLDAYNQALTGDKAATLGVNCGMTTGQNGVITDMHILDDQGGSVINIRTDGQSPTLRAQMGGHPPVVLDAVYAVDQGGGKSSVVVRNNQSPTLTCTHDGSPAVAYGIDVYNQTTTGDKAKTLTSIKSDADHVPCVTYSFDPGASRDVGALFIEECAKTLTNGTCPGHHDGVVISENPIAIDRAFFNQGKNALYDPRVYEDGTTSTLVAKGPGAVCHPSPPRYIVRRLSPTECARLQGFADNWGDTNPITEFSDEEYTFWLDVRNTHAAINGKKTKEYTKAQMLAWYNKLHTDSAEYKMWGNGIALPTALYVMQGIKEASNESY